MPSLRPRRSDGTSSRPLSKQRSQPPPIRPREPVAFSIVDAVKPSVLLPPPATIRSRADHRPSWMRRWPVGCGSAPFAGEPANGSLGLKPSGAVGVQASRCEICDIRNPTMLGINLRLSGTSSRVDDLAITLASTFGPRGRPTLAPASRRPPGDPSDAQAGWPARLRPPRIAVGAYSRWP